MLLRSFAVQASWNYRTLIGTGFCFVMLPVLRAVHGRGERLQEAVRQHSGIFNSHPYLVGIAAGAVARMEIDGADPHLVERFKAAVRGSLGSLGDRLVWAGWRPVCALLAVAGSLAGASWWQAGLLFLVLYNVGHLAIRIGGFQLGLHHGRNVAERLRALPLDRVQRSLWHAGAFLVGVLAPLVAGGELLAARLPFGWLLLGAAATAGGVRLGTAVRGPVALLLALSVVVAFGFGAFR
jgi:PTS system mannose-specific IID component